MILCRFFLFLCSFFPFALFSQVGKLEFQKIAPALKQAYLTRQSDSLDVTATFKNPESFITLYRQKIRILQYKDMAASVVFRMPTTLLPHLSSDKNLLFINLNHLPREEITTGFVDKATNKINLMHNEFPAFNGDNIVLSIKEQKVDTSDLDFRGRYIASSLESPNITTHASLMATMAAGGGNSSPSAKGVAWGSVITSVSFSNLFPETDSFFRTKNVSVQNHSYGTVVENFYGSEAMAYDLSAANNTALLHVFSAGNSGTLSPTSGLYAGMSGTANLTGNFKMAKNILTVGAIDSFYIAEPQSSQGPAYDGRLKPELVAFGQDGSSGAAALVSGAATVLQQAYRNDLGNLPPSHLIKALLINSADDVGQKGIDFKTGYGNLNAFRAMKTLKEKTFFQNTITNAEIKNFNLVIPQGTQYLKITVAWNDVAAPVNAAKALINNLDATLINTVSGTRWQPWLLNHFPHLDSLKTPAIRKRDTLNTVEQITVENPEPGNYVLEIKGSQITTGGTAFSIAYQLDGIENFKWSFPTATDVVRAGEKNIIRWMSNSNFSGTIEYSVNNGIWQLLNTTPDISRGFIGWDAVDTVATAQVRMTTAQGRVFISDTFVLSRAINLNTGFNCPDSFLLYWNKLPVNDYQLFSLGSKYLEPVLATSDTFSILKKNLFPSIYYSVAPKIKNKLGQRSFLLNYTAKGVACYFQSFYLQLQTDQEALFVATLGSVYGVKNVSFQKLINNQFLNLSSVNNPTSLAFLFKDSVFSQGVNTYRLQITLQNGQTLFSDIIPIYHFKGSDLIVYPNPAGQQIPVTIITNKAGRITLEIFNAAGMLVQKLPLKNLLNYIQTLQLSKGIYFLRAITDEGQITTQKLVIY